MLALSRNTLFAFLASASAPALADTVVECRGCDLQAMSAAATHHGAGMVVVWNPVDAAIHRYEVRCGVNPSFPTAGSTDDRKEATTIAAPGCFAEEADLAADLAAIAAALSTVYNGTSGTWFARFDVEARHWTLPGWTQRAPTANDYVSDANLRAMLNDRLRKGALAHAGEAPLAGAFAYLLAHADAAAAFTDKPRAALDVTFTNGSKVRVDVQPGGPAQYVEGSARDETGQFVPDANAANYAGSWHYDGDQHLALERLVHTIEGLGGKVVRGDTDASLRCVWNRADARLACKVKPQ